MITVSDLTPNPKNVSVVSTEKTIAFTPKRLFTILISVAMGVFFMTSYFYETRDKHQRSMSMASTPAVVVTTPPRGFKIMQFSSQKSPKANESSLMMPSSTSLATIESSTSPLGTEKAGRFHLGPVASEVGIVVALQAIFPLVSKAIVVARQIKWASFGIRISPMVGRFLNSFGKWWKTAMLFYKKTAVSKVVTRSKKMVKVFKYHDDDEHHHHQTQDGAEHNGKRHAHHA